MARRHLIIDNFASAGILVAETALQAGHADLVARHQAFEIAIQGRLQGAVVDTALRARDAIIQRAGRDVGLDIVRVRADGIVARIGAAQAHTSDIDALARINILVAKRRSGRHRQGVALDAVVPKADLRTRCAVIGLVDAVETHVQGTHRDVGRGAAGIGAQHIVAGVGAAHAHVRHRNGLADACILVAKGCIARQRQGVALDAVVAKADLRARRAVVGLADAIKTHVQGPRADVGRGAAGIRVQHIVARILARQVARRHLIIDNFASAGILVAETALQAGHADLVARHQAFEIAIQGRLHGAVIDAALRARDAVVQDACRDGRRAICRAGSQAIVAQFVAAQGEAAGVHSLAAAHILVEESGAAADADGVARHHVAQHKAGAVVAQVAVIYLAIAADTYRQGARRDGKGGRAAHRDIVLGRPQARRCIVAHIARVAAVAEAAVDARVAIEQSHIAYRAEEGRQLTIVDLARGVAREVHLQRLQESLQHRRRVAVVDAPHAAEIIVVEHALLLHLRRAAAAGAAAIHLHQRRFIIEKTIGKRGTGGHAAGYRAHCRIAVACHGAAAEDMADAARAFTDQSAHVFPGQDGIGRVCPAHGAAGVRIIDAAAIQAHQAADAARAADIAGGIRLAQRALVIADQAADHFTRARHHAGGVRGRDAGAGRIQSRQAADGAAAVGIHARDRAAADGHRDGAAVAAHQAADIALAADGHAAVHAIDSAAHDIARQRAHVRRAADTAAAQGQVAQGTALDGAKQACRRPGRQAAVDFQIAESKSGAIEHAGKTAAAAGNRHKTLAIVPVRRAAGVDIASQAIAVAKTQAGNALQAVDIGEQIR